MYPSNDGHRGDAEHITISLFRWIIFLALSLLLLGAVAWVLVAIWRWIF
jgi:hypothetical protein